jgi:HlyD family secretion protein
MAKTLGERVTKFIRKRWLLLTIAAIVLVTAVLIFNSISGGQARALASLQTVPLERGKLTASIGATGTVRAQQSATLVWGTSGNVELVTAEVGDSVSEDEVLASLGLSSLPQNIILAHLDLETAQDAVALEIANSGKALAEAQNALEDAERVLYNLEHPGKQVDIDQAWANLVLAEDKLEDAREDYEPYADKPEDNLTRANYLLRFTEAQKEYDSAVRIYNSFSGTANDTDIAIARGQVQLAEGQLVIAQRNYENALKAADPSFTSSAEAQLAAAQATLDLASIKAPFAGTVTDAFPTEGDQVAAGAMAFQVDDLSHLLVDVQVSEVDINNVQVGQSAVITFDAAPEREYAGIVTGVALSGTVESGVVNFRVTVEISEPDEFVRPGMTAAVNVVTTELEDVLLLPNRAVRVMDGKRVVYVLRNGALTPVEITLGASSETYSEITSGDIQEGDIIVLNPPISSFDPSEPPQGGRFLMGS